MLKIDHNHIQTLGQLKAAGYRSRHIKDEMRENLVNKLQQHNVVFPGIHGYDHTVLPDLETAILSRHNIVFLGLRGQAKTRMARLMVNLLDEFMPIIAESELNEDPLQPFTHAGKEALAHYGDETPIAWVHRSERYTEKLATPDVSIADLIGDVDPIKAANLKLPYSDERVIHYGLIPRSHRSIFVINELPDLQPRIQVALFNILQEEDLQIRGFKLRLPLDVAFVFTANPEDYTNRGLIVTPLKDRIDSQILTHYPKSIDISRQITRQEARLAPAQKERVFCCELAQNLVEQIAVEARRSEYVDAKSGVSARLTISGYENLLSAAERRLLIHKETTTAVRMNDFVGVIPAITGKVELVYEGDQEGALKVAHILLGKAVRTLFPYYFPDPEKIKRKKDEVNPYEKIVRWFENGNSLDFMNETPSDLCRQKLFSVPGLADVVRQYHPREDELTRQFLMEFLLHGLAEFSVLSKSFLEQGFKFKDLVSSMLSSETESDLESKDLNGVDL